ncbi:MAG: tagaturonate reductase, partial [Bacteroidota bacterium]
MAQSLPVLSHVQAGVQLNDRPIRVLQFGEGNFLRAFVDWMIHRMNAATDFRSGVAVVQPIPFGRVSDLMQQDGLYHVLIRGLENGEPIERVERIDVLQQGINPYEDYAGLLAIAASKELQFVVSNTTEAGIVYQSEPQPAPGISPESFPAKVCALLHHRYVELGKKEAPGLIFLPCELIE